MLAQKELVTYHNPDTYPLGSFELIASNRVRPPHAIATALRPSPDAHVFRNPHEGGEKITKRVPH